VVPGPAAAAPHRLGFKVEVRMLRDHPGIEIVVDGRYGRSLVASGRSFTPGDQVLVENPLLEGKQGDADLFEQYIRFESCDEETRIAVLSLYRPLHSDINIPRVESRRALIDQIVSKDQTKNNISWSTDRQSQFLDFVLICDYNIHCLSDSNDLYDNILEEKGGQALFLIASMGNHSCSPNCSFSTDSGQLVLTAIKNIADGEAITYSYIQIMGRTTDDRRAELMDTKNFMCMCVKCMLPDSDRGLQHRTAKGAYCGIALLHHVAFTEDKNTNISSPRVEWRCTKCGVLSTKNKILKKSLLREKELIDKMTELKQNTIEKLTLPMIESILSSDSVTGSGDDGYLCHSHSLVVDFLRLYSTVAQSWCQILQNNENYPQNNDASFFTNNQIKQLLGDVSSFSELCYLSGLAGFRAVLLYECSSSQCLQPWCNITHESPYSCAHEAFYAMLEFEKCLIWENSNYRRRSWVDRKTRKQTFYAKSAILLITLYYKYLMHLTVAFGKDDEDMKRLRSMVEDLTPILPAMGYTAHCSDFGDRTATDWAISTACSGFWPFLRQD
jgi:hypothetical protein